MPEIIWLPEAVADLARLISFLRDRNPAAAMRAAQAIRTGAAGLRAMPEIGRPMQDDTGRRELVIPFGAGAYILRYRLHGGDIVVIRVWHSREARF